MNLPVDFVKQTYDSLKQKDYALSDDFLVKKIYEIINKLGIKCKLGELIIQAGSRHIYESDFNKLDNIFASNFDDKPEISFNKLIDKYKDEPLKFVKILEEMADLEGTELRPNGMLTERLNYLLYG